ncbi:MAG: hypothetical protein WBM69_16955, partial [Desulfobacterales bacterium]
IAADYLRTCFRRWPHSLFVHRSMLSKIVCKFLSACRFLSIPALLFFLTVCGLGSLFGGEQAYSQERAAMPKASRAAATHNAQFDKEPEGIGVFARFHCSPEDRNPWNVCQRRLGRPRRYPEPRERSIRLGLLRHVRI